MGRPRMAGTMLFKGVAGEGLGCEDKLMHSWRFALREGVFAENKERICRNKSKKTSLVVMSAKLSAVGNFIRKKP